VSAHESQPSGGDARDAIDAQKRSYDLRAPDHLASVGTDRRETSRMTTPRRTRP